MNEEKLKRIKAEAGKHVAICAMVAAILMCVVRCTVNHFFDGYSEQAFYPVAIGFLYSLAETLTVTFSWQMVATRRTKFLPTFHMACSGFRLLATLAILFVVYLIVGRDGIAPYFVVLALNYFLLLILHSSFFTRQSQYIFSAEDTNNNKQ